jgi:hypothetical protein
MAMKQHMILGKNLQDLEARRDEWISENPHITVVRVHPPKREPESWLTLLGGRDVPRVSLIVEYEVNTTSDGEKDSTLSPT